MDSVRRTLTATYGQLPRAFWFQWVGTLVNRLGTFVEPFLVLYLTTARGLSAPQAGLILAAYGAGALVAPLLGGFLADRIGRRWTLAGGMFAAAIALAALGAARDPLLIGAAALAVGLTGDLYRPASAALVADVVEPKLRPKAYGLLFWAVNLGFSVAAVGGGWVAEHGYGLLFAISTVTCATFGALILIGVRKETAPSRQTGTRGGGYGEAFRDPLLLAVVGLTIGYATIYTQAYVTLPLVTHDAGLSPAQYGTIIAVNGIAIVLFQPFAASWLSRFNRMKVLAGSLVVLGLGFGLTAFASTQLTYAGTVLVWTIGEIGTAGFVQALVADLAPARSRGRYSGMLTLGFSSSAVLAPAIGTNVYAAFGSTAIWVGCLVLSVVLAACWLALDAPMRRRLAAISSETGPVEMVKATAGPAAEQVSNDRRQDVTTTS